MTEESVRRVNAVEVLRGEGFFDDEGGMRRERAIVTIFIYSFHLIQSGVRVGGKENTPGPKANIFGTALPIQKGKWNWEHVRRVKKREVRWPKRRETVHRRRMRERAVTVDRTRRTVRFGLVGE